MTVSLVVSDDSLAFSTYISHKGISAISLNYIVYSTGEDEIRNTQTRHPDSNEFARNWVLNLLLQYITRPILVSALLQHLNGSDQAETGQACLLLHNGNIIYIYIGTYQNSGRVQKTYPNLSNII